MYRSAIVGARRGLHHAQAYEGSKRLKVVALCEIDDERRETGVRALNVPGYSKYETMLNQERPDIVHVVTSPSVPRAPWLEPTAAHGVKALVIEKPIALIPSEADALREAHRKTGLKVIVNHQRRYMPFANRLRELLADGRLGDVHFVRASTQGEITDMATHLLDLALLAVGDAPPTAVWAAVEGGSTYAYPTLRCPENLMATFTFEGGARVLFESARKAFGTVDYPGVEKPPFPYRCNIDVWASKGRFWWRENGSWGYQVDGMAEPFTEPTEFFSDDVPAQRAFTEAIADWLDNDDRPHHCRLENALAGFDCLMGAYRSALYGKRLPFDAPLTDAEWERLRDSLIA